MTQTDNTWLCSWLARTLLLTALRARERMYLTRTPSAMPAVQAQCSLAHLSKEKEHNKAMAGAQKQYSVSHCYEAHCSNESSPSRACS